MSSESKETGEPPSPAPLQRDVPSPQQDGEGGSVTASESLAHPACWGPALILSLEVVSDNVHLGGELSCVIHVQRGASCPGGSRS